MAVRFFILGALVAAAPVSAESVQFRGHALGVEAGPDGRTLVAMEGAPYSIPGSPAQIIGKAQACLAQPGSGAGVASVDMPGGRLRAVSRTAYAQSRLVRSRWSVEAGEGSFRVVFTDVAEIRGSGIDEAYVPLSMQSASGWEDALGAVIGLEQSLVDCMYR